MGLEAVLVQPTLGHTSTSVNVSPPPQPTLATEPSPIAQPPLAPEQTFKPDTAERIPLGIFLLDKIVNGTVGSLTLDLKRPFFPRAGAKTLFTYSSHEAQNPSGSYRINQTQPARRYRARGRLSREGQEQRRQFVEYGSLPSLSFGNTGARIKAMRHLRFGRKITYTKHARTITAPSFDFGVGGNFEFDTAVFQPLVRLKFRDLASLQLLPEPAIRLHRRIQLGTSGFGVRIAYECPLESLSQFYAPPARLLLSMDNTVENGIRLTQSGLEMHANQWLLNGDLRFKASGVLQLPSELPIDEDDMLFRFEARRLGFKTRW